MNKENVNENIDSQNDEMLEEEIEETQEEKTERAKSQIDRLKAEREKAKQEAEELRLKLQKYETKPTETVEKKTSNDGYNEDKINNLELKIAGIKDAEDRELVLSYAKMNGVSVEEALETSFVKRGLTINKQERVEQNANVEPNNRVADKSGDAMLRKALNHYNKTGEVLEGLDIVTTNKLLKHLKTK